MPHEIVSAEVLVADDDRRTVQLEVRAPDVIRRWRPGQFVIVRTAAGGERIPLTVVDVDGGEGTIRLVVQEVGKTTRDVVRLRAGDALADVCGPLGVPSEIERYGTCVVVAGGYGVAAVLPIARELRGAGNRVVGILGARTADLVILAGELGEVVDELHVVTEDGSSGRAGTVLDPLRELVEHQRADRVLAIGPMRMMEAVADLTRPLGITTVVSLNPIMIDGTGMCGACRVHVGGDIHFACVDGPEFDAHAVDFDELAARLGMFREEESIALETCHG
jgi:NAD(P)H-flavin reductase